VPHHGAGEFGRRSDDEIGDFDAAVMETAAMGKLTLDLVCAGEVSPSIGIRVRPSSSSASAS
jgi:hypothetical protein